MINRYRGIIFYGSFLFWGFFVTALVVCLFFPYQKAMKIAFQNVVGGSKAVVAVDGIRVAPMGVHIAKARIGHEAVQGKALVELSDVRITWHPWSLLTGTFSIGSKASAYNGTITCDVVGIPVLTKNNPSMKVSFQNLDLSRYPAGSLPWFKKVSGIAEGSVNKEVPLLHASREKGSFSLTVRNGSIQDLYTRNIQGLVVPFKEVRAEGRLDGSEAVIDRIFLKGSGITMKGSGTLSKGDPQNALNLKLLYESRSAIPLPPRGTILISGSQWSPTVTVSTEVPETVEKKQ